MVIDDNNYVIYDHMHFLTFGGHFEYFKVTERNITNSEKGKCQKTHAY